jgi:two-component system CheB/CheR fusion protein
MTDENEPTSPAPFTLPIIVGVGASAAAPESLERFLSRMQIDGDQVVVLVVQHREALNEARLRDMMDGVDGLEIAPAEHGAPVAGGAVYLCEPDRITTLRDARFVVRKAEPGDGAIDSFLRSLVEDRGEEAVGVLLAGADGDGALGVAALKQHGGLAIAERDPDAAQPAETSETPAALADFLLPAEDIPDHVRAYVRHLRRVSERKGFDAMLAAAAGSLIDIADILRKKTGNDFHGYKQNTFLRRVQRRMQVIQIDDIDAYVERLRHDKDEAQNLFNDLLIGVTQFFRDRNEFEIFEKIVIPRLFANRGAGQRIRVWVLGCATGEEAYSIAILLREYMATLDAPPQAQIFATDIDGRALAAARVGRFRTTIEDDVAPERLERWFQREGDAYVVVKELREMCIFSQHNVIKDAPFSKLDLISCRNLLIYLSAELQFRIIPLFHFALLPDRYLFLGNSENATRHSKLFAPVDRRARIFKRLDSGVRAPPEFPITLSSARGSLVSPAARTNAAPDHGLERRAQRVAERYAPAYVITDEHFHVLNFSGRTGRYLEPAPGVATLELISLVHRDLRLELRTALNRALESGAPVTVERVPLGAGEARVLVDMTIEPVDDPAGGPRSFVVLFKDGPAQASEPADAAGHLVRSEHVERLETELRATRERLQATIEELESANEELKSSNEEYQSLNEELQSANEELETSREELQSVNEELTTVNGELAHRVQALTRATSDLKNFLESTQIATVFLDNDLRVMNFTPAVTQVFHLVETDIGRPIGHIKARIPIEDLFDDVRRVLRTLATVERAVLAPDSDTRYIVRILPYRSIDNFIAGVVITFVDVTAISRAEERQKLLLAELQHRVRNTLGVVRTIARRTAESSATVESYADSLDGRLNAFSRTQALVTRDPEAGVNLEYLVQEELAAYRGSDGRRLRIAGPSVRLKPKAAETFGLAIHELTTNAVKHGALSGAQGRVDVRWRVERAPAAAQLIFEWRESDGPPIPDGARRRGFGTELLEQTLAFDLKALSKLSFEPTGLRCEIQLPLTDRIVMPG